MKRLKRFYEKKFVTDFVILVRYLNNEMCEKSNEYGKYVYQVHTKFTKNKNKYSHNFITFLS